MFQQFSNRINTILHRNKNIFFLSLPHLWGKKIFSGPQEKTEIQNSISDRGSRSSFELKLQAKSGTDCLPLSFTSFLQLRVLGFVNYNWDEDTIVKLIWVIIRDYYFETKISILILVKTRVDIQFDLGYRLIKDKKNFQGLDSRNKSEKGVTLMGCNQNWSQDVYRWEPSRGADTLLALCQSLISFLEIQPLCRTFIYNCPIQGFVGFCLRVENNGISNELNKRYLLETF